MSDRYRLLDDPTQFDPPMHQCRDCNLVIENTRVHDRWHLRQAARDLIRWGMENQPDE